MAARRRYRQPKTPVLIGCEGPSEAGYVRWLNQLAGRENFEIALRDENLRGGDVLAMVETFLEKKALLRRQGKPYRHFAILLDHDPHHDSPDRIAAARRLAASDNVDLIWQSPCHEAFLLRHFEDFQRHRPVDKRAAERQLSSVWPTGYAKGMAARGYEAELTLDHIRRARAVEAEFDAFLTSIGWPR